MKKPLKKILALCLLAALLLGMAPEGTALAAGSRFRDVSSTIYYYNAVNWAVEEGITTGTSQETFSPERMCTRAQVVTFLYRMLDGSSSGSGNPFRDVPGEEYFCGPVLWAVKEGITQGSSAALFSPNRGCTRAQVVTFLWRAAGCPEPQTGVNPFTDVPQREYYHKAVLWAVERGITNGMTPTSFAPERVCTRAQIVTFLYRYGSPLLAESAIYTYDRQTETALAKVGQFADLADCPQGAYYSFRADLKNNTPEPLACSEVYVVVDGGQPWRWQAFTLQPGAWAKLHIFYSNMQLCSGVGTHTAVWYVNGTAVCETTFGFRDSQMAQPSSYWKDVFPLPTQAQINAYTNPDGCRSPYLAGWLDIDRNTRFTEYSIDFKSDHAPLGTYCCLANWAMDMSELKKTHTNVHTEYAGVSAYAGFQHTATDKGMASILSFWDIYATDARGKEITIRPTLVYPANDGDDSFTGEGTGAHRIVPYAWEEGHWYRMLLQSYPSPQTGNTLVDQWVCDLQTGSWTRLCCYDTGLKNSHFVGSSAFFLENYLTGTAGQLRSMELRNARIRELSTGQWRNVEGAYLCSQGGKPKYEGSYAFGAREDRFWMITSGVGGDWYNNGKGQMAGDFAIHNTDIHPPY